MRIRSTKPEFWRSKTIAERLPDWCDRFVLKGLESYVDDNGVGKDDLALIAADVFPRDLSANPRDTLARLSEAISRIAAALLIVRYEVDGEKLLYIDKWKDIQRIDKPSKGRFPRPDGSYDYIEPVDRTTYRTTLANPPETLAPGTGEQGNRGTGESSLVTLGGGCGGNPPTAPVAAEAAPAKTKRGQHLPDSWRPNDNTIAWAKEHFPHVDLRAEFEKFTNHWQAASGQNARKRDWDAAFRNWLHNARAPVRNGHAPTNGVGKPTQKAIGWQAVGDQVLAEMEQS